jgi:CBS-domain-containing membrane protein
VGFERRDAHSVGRPKGVGRPSGRVRSGDGGKDGKARVGFKLHDKLGALKDLAARLGIDKAEVEGLYATRITAEQRRKRILKLVKIGRRRALSEDAAKAGKDVATKLSSGRSL